ncbi:hypothetical protein ES703_96000 [subsurface metagenome]
MADHETVTKADVDSKVTTHEEKTTGVHGVGASAVCSETEADNKIAARVPSGLIVIWHGTIGNIPAGWVLCDGGSGTPNLLAKFIEGVATAGTNPGATGGATAKTTGGHQHDAPISYADIGNYIAVDEKSPFGKGNNITPTHKVDFTTTSITGVEAAKSKSNTDSITDIRPKFYDIAFIMKT